MNDLILLDFTEFIGGIIVFGIIFGYMGVYIGAKSEKKMTDIFEESKQEYLNSLEHHKT